jgi:DNA-binding LacI/PurR family transcriptional regulator
VTERYETLLSAAKKHRMELVLGHDQPFTQATDFLNLTVKANGATAIITYDHRIAVRLVGAATTMGLRIPHDFSLICFNDVYPVDLLAPPITAIAVSGREMGRVGADLLLKQLQSKRPQKVCEIRIPEDLVVRGSTAPPPEMQ